MTTTYKLGNREFTHMECGECGIEFYVPLAFQKEQREKGPRGGWYCPNGHSRIYRDSDVDIMRRERDALQQRIAEKDDEIAAQRRRAEFAERKTSAARGQITKIKKRAANGVCPCCNRTFADLARHMAGKHPGFVAEPTADEQVVN